MHQGDGGLFYPLMHIHMFLASWSDPGFALWIALDGHFLEQQKGLKNAAHAHFQMDNSAIVSLWPNLRAELCPFPMTAFIICGTLVEADSR